MAKSARRNQKKNRSSKRRRVVKGGSGAADWALAAFGGPGQQHAQAGSNLIAVRDASVPVVVAGQAGGMLALTPAQAGGMGHLSPAQAGGMVALTPAVLKGGKKGGALLALSPMTLSEVKNVNDVSNVVKGGAIVFEIPPGMELSDAVTDTTTIENAENDEINQYFKDTNGNLFMLKQSAPQQVSESEQLPSSVSESNGGSLLNDVAVPAVLLLGNRMFRGKRGGSAKRNTKRRSSRRARR
jgi:hypothetical protein